MAIITKQETTKKFQSNIKAELGQELVVTTLNEAGVMADVAKIIAEKGVSILAVSTWLDGVNRVVHLVTDDNLRAKEALEKKTFDVRENRVILARVPHKPGLLKHMTESLRNSQADIHHLYGSAPLNGDTCLIVVASADNDVALVAMTNDVTTA